MDNYTIDGLKKAILKKDDKDSNKPFDYANHININTVIELIEDDADMEKSIFKLVNKNHFDTLDRESKRKYLFYLARNYLCFKNSYQAMQKQKTND